jgi:hypothetical protein
VEIVTTVFPLIEVGLTATIVLAGKPLTLKVTTPSIHSLFSRLPCMSFWILLTVCIAGDGTMVTLDIVSVTDVVVVILPHIPATVSK